MVIVAGNDGDLSSNPARICLCFHSANTLGKELIQLFSFQLLVNSKTECDL